MLVRVVSGFESRAVPPFGQAFELVIRGSVRMGHCISHGLICVTLVDSGFYFAGSVSTHSLAIGSAVASFEDEHPSTPFIQPCGSILLIRTGGLGVESL